MKCPYCGNLDDKVIDSRMSREGDVIRRRRECLKCEKRFTSYERIEESLPVVVKKDRRREPYQRAKVIAGLKKACEKRKVSTDELEAIADRIEKTVLEMGDREIPSYIIGEEVMKALKELDKVAYIRFASVYRAFEDINQFLDEIKALFEAEKKSEETLN